MHTARVFSEKRRHRRRSERGFSLMEILMVTAILPVILFAVFANMTSGMRVWKTLNQPVSEEDTAIFMDRFRADLGSVLVYKSAPFTGESGELAFMGTVLSPKALGGEWGIGRIGYRLDDSQHALVREEWNYSQLYKEAAPHKKVVLTGVSSATFSYLVYVPADQMYVWNDAWQPGKQPLPSAVRLTVTRVSGESWVQSVGVPCGN